MRTHKHSFVTLLVFAMIVCGTARADVIISEIMYSPDGTDHGVGFTREWIEIFNSGAATVDIGGWVFEDIQDATPALPIPGGTMLDPGEAIVLAGDADMFDSQWGSGINRIELGNFPILSSSPSPTNEILALKDSLGVTQDVVNYDDEAYWPTDITAGPSIYVLPEFLSGSGNDHGSHWGSSTPGIDEAYYSQPTSYYDRASPGIVATETTVFAPFTPSPDASWSMVVLPDTQGYVKAQANMPYFHEMTTWVRDNRDDFNIQVVLHEGDIVNKNNNESPPDGENPSTLQWQNAKDAMSTLDGEVPYILAAGNHDFGIDDAEDRTTRLNEFFAASDNPLVDPLQGGILKGVMEPGHLENAYYEVSTPDGRELLIISLAWDPQNQHKDWAKQVANHPDFADHTTILLTHSFLGSDSTRTSDGQYLWNKLVKKNGNFEMVFSGHVGGDGTGYLMSTAQDGNQVHQMVFNTQYEGNGGNSWIRVLEFLDDGQTVRVRTYSPTFGYLREDIENAFTFELSPILYDLADFDHDGVVDGNDLALWSDGFGITTGASWSDGDADRDGDVDGSDYLQWQLAFGVASGSAAVPEPSSLSIVFGFVLILSVWRKPERQL